MSSRYAKRTKTTKPAKIKLGRFQVVSIIFTVAIVCVLIAGVAGSIVVDSFNDDGDDTDQAAITNEDILPQLQDAAADNPDDPDAQASLANYLANTGQFEQALPYYERAIALAPDDWVLRLDFAQALMDNDKLSDAEFQFDTILEQDPTNPQGWFYLAELYMRFTPPREDEAIFAYQQVIRYDPESYIAEQAGVQLTALGVVASPVASPAASPEALP